MSNSWVTWEQAAAIVGCPVPTIDYNVRVGRIERRPHHGARPCLQRRSVEAFAIWYAERAEERRRRRQLKTTPPASRADGRRSERSTGRPKARAPGQGWVPSAIAADLLDVTRPHVTVMAKAGQIPAQQVDGRWWFDEAALIDQVRERDEWVSILDAARIVDTSASAIARAAQTGLIEQRDVDRWLPSLRRQSVDRFRSQHAAEEQRRDRERARAGAERRRRRAQNGPPDDGQVWLDALTAGLVLGVSVGRVRQLARASRLPHELRAGRYWFRRTDVEQVAAARAFRLLASA